MCDALSHGLDADLSLVRVEDEDALLRVLSVVGEEVELSSAKSAIEGR
jgi:hypothetical protein